jgi:hypothetical protein
MLEGGLAEIQEKEFSEWSPILLNKRSSNAILFVIMEK